MFINMKAKNHTVGKKLKLQERIKIIYVVGSRVVCSVLRA